MTSVRRMFIGGAGLRAGVVLGKPGVLVALLLAVLLTLGGTLMVQLAAAPPATVELAAYATSLRGRTRGQKRNARLAAQNIDGYILKPGATFSFNRIVKGWSMDQGYVKAPVSFDGELVRAFGGGVCQTSTTLYNAALLAGLPIVERHPHVFVPGYIPPGRDAAVAYPGVDLRFRNPYSWPLRIRAGIAGERLVVRIVGAHEAPGKVHIVSEVLDVARPQRLTRRLARGGPSRRAYLRSPGTYGYRVVTYREFSEGGRLARRERLGDDSYPVMNRVIAVQEPA